MNRRSFLLSIPGIYFVSNIASALDGVENEEIEKIALKQFGVFGTALGIGTRELDSPRCELRTTYIVVETGSWHYNADLAGNQTFRPVTTLPYVGGGGRGYSFYDYRLHPDRTEIDQLKHLVNALAGRLGCDNKSLSNTILKKEVVISGGCNDAPLYRDGRLLVRLAGQGADYFQILCDVSGKAIRIDTSIRSGAVSRLSDLLLQRCAISDKPVDARVENGARLQLGTFYDPDEYRFETGAYSYEGEEFLQISEAQNPFKHGDFTGSPVELTVNGIFDAQRRTDLVDHAAWRKTDDYRYWTFYFWNLYGRSGGVRGNWNKKAMAWDEPNILVAHHNLKSYGLVGGEPTQTNDVELSDHKRHRFPFDTSRQLITTFYDDLEDCTVAAFLTHGGAIKNRFQLRRGLDVWFVPARPYAKLGSGRLRHVFFEGCGAMGAFKERNSGGTYQSLLAEWLPSKYVDGLRTACGGDGSLDTSGCGGWRFFEKYNEGDSISDAWLLAMVNESAVANSPVTVAYGSTLKEAIATLADGRFKPEKAEPKFVAASVWVEI